MSTLNDLNRINKMVYKKFMKKANSEQRKEMKRILRAQLENLKILLWLMEKEEN